MHARTAAVAIALVLLGSPGFADAPAGWAKETRSPRSLAFDARDRELGSTCPETDAALAVVALDVARHRISADDVDAVTYSLRASGEPHVWPRAMALEGRAVDSREARTRIEEWLSSTRRRGHLRCAVARAREEGRETVAAVAVDAEADLAPIALVARLASWVEVDAHVLVPAAAAKVFVLGPRGVPHAVPTSFDGLRVRARANVDCPGAWVLQVVLDGEAGPHPVLEALVFAGVRPEVRPGLAAPGEELGDGGGGADALAQMITAARASEGLASLRSDRTLDRVARSHSEWMMRVSELGHDVGDGGVRQRLEAAGIVAAIFGENVAHAPTVALAHHALWASPSHRDNILGPRYVRVGTGVSNGSDGTVWVTELFATSR